LLVELRLDEALDIAVDRELDVGAGLAWFYPVAAEGDGPSDGIAFKKSEAGVPLRISSRSASRPASPEWSRPRKPIRPEAMSPSG
jgi:hypothetical protein